MKRYFLIPPGQLPHELPEQLHLGEYHYIDLDSHGAAGNGHCALLLMDGTKQPPATWLELPHLLDAQATLGDAARVQHLKLLADVGAKAGHGGYALAKQLATIHPLFNP